MNLGALNALAEVGIGSNLAFGIVYQFRESLTTELDRRSKQAGAKAAAMFADISGKLNGSDGWQHAGVAIIESLVEGRVYFTGLTSKMHRVFIFLSILSAMLLIGFLSYAAIHGDDQCENCWLTYVLCLSVAPIALWALSIYGTYLKFRLDIWRTLRRYRRDIDGVKRLTSRSITPTEPSPSARP